MRKAIRTQLKTITALKEVYQPYMAPNNAETPYAVVKYGDKLLSVDNKKGKFQSFFVFIYNKASDFKVIDDIISNVISKLDDVLLSYDTGKYLRPEYVQTLEDLRDDTTGLLFKRVDFRLPLVT